MSTSDHAEDLPGELAAAETALEEARERVAEFGEADLQHLADVYDEFTDLLDRYEEPATGDSDFETFIEFQGRVETFVERLDDDLLLAESFVEADEHLQQRRLSESDFDHVRQQLQPVADLVARLEERDRAREEYRTLRQTVQRRVRELDDRIEELRRLERLGSADLGAPTDRLREPIRTYDETVTDAFAEFRREASARELFAFLEATAAFPLVEFQLPPQDLRTYVKTHEPGTEPIPQLLEYADYSRSKLDHYVDEPDPLKRAVSTHRTYLRRLDGDPLTIGWPPPAARRLAWRCRELTSVLNRLDPALVEQLRTVRALPRETDYGRLRESAIASAELSPDERTRLREGTVETELADALAKRDELEAALDAHPER